MKWGMGVVGLAAVGVIAVAAIGVGSSASAQTPPDDEQTRADRYRELLANELGITVDELTTAQTAARDKLVDEAVAAGGITSEQGDKIKSMDIGEGRFGFGFGMGNHPMGAKIRNAVVSVFQTAADVVGVPVDELRTRIAGGESLVDIAASNNIDEATLKSDLTSALTDKINQAVIDGDIEQNKADMLLANLDDIVDRAINADGPFEGRMRFGGGGDFHPFHMRGNQN